MWSCQILGEIGYWFIAGAAIGTGLISITSIGIPLLLLGVALILYAVKKVGRGVFWATSVGLGAMPAFLLLYPYFTTEHCPPTGTASFTVSPDKPTMSCTGFPDSYLYSTMIFVVITLIGIAWGMVLHFQRRAVKD